MLITLVKSKPNFGYGQTKLVVSTFKHQKEKFASRQSRIFRIHFHIWLKELDLCIFHLRIKHVFVLWASSGVCPYQIYTLAYYITTTDNSPPLPTLLATKQRIRIEMRVTFCDEHYTYNNKRARN